MNRLRSYEGKRLTATSVLVAAGALGLAGCGGGFSPKERLAECTLEEIQGQKPVDLRPFSLQDIDISLLERAIKVHPQVLLDTARRLSNPKDSSADLLNGTIDEDHAPIAKEWFPPSGDDSIDNPGDILCETTPLGDSDSKARKVYYDKDGQALLKKVEAGLERLDTTR